MDPLGGLVEDDRERAPAVPDNACVRVELEAARAEDGRRVELPGGLVGGLLGRPPGPAPARGVGLAGEALALGRREDPGLEAGVRGPRLEEVDDVVADRS